MNGSEVRELARLARGRLPSADEMATIRRRRLRELVAYVHARVPYYRRLLDDAGVAPGDIRDIEDLRLIPVSTRVQLRGAGSEIFARGFDPERAIAARTSGSSATPGRSTARAARTCCAAPSSTARCAPPASGRAT